MKKGMEEVNDGTRKLLETVIRINDLITNIPFPDRKKALLIEQISETVFNKKRAWLYRYLALGKFLSKKPVLLTIPNTQDLLKLVYASKKQQIRIADELLRNSGIAMSALISSESDGGIVDAGISSGASENNSENTSNGKVAQKVAKQDAAPETPTARNPVPDDGKTIDGSALIRESEPQASVTVIKEINDLKAKLAREQEVNRQKDEALSRLTLEITQLRNLQSAIQSEQIVRTEKAVSLTPRHSLPTLRDEVRRFVSMLNKLSAKPKRNSTLKEKDIADLLVDMSSLLDSLNTVVRA